MDGAIAVKLPFLWSLPSKIGAFVCFTVVSNCTNLNINQWKNNIKGLQNVKKYGIINHRVKGGKKMKVEIVNEEYEFKAYEL